MKKMFILLALGTMIYSCAWFKTEPRDQLTEEEQAEYLREEEMRLARADNLVSEGINFYQLGKDSMAVEEWRRALEINPYDAEVHNFIGIALHRMGKLEKALADFEMATKLKADYYQAYNNIGYMNFLLGNYEAALGAFNAALEINPQYEPAQKNKRLVESVLSGNLSKRAFEIAEQASREYDTEKQIEGYRKVLAIDSTYAMAQNNIAVAYYYEGKIDSAYIHLKKALELNRDYPEALNNLGYLYKIDRNYELAIQLFLKALSLKPRYVAAMNNLAETYRLNHEAANARRVYKTVLDFEPYNAVAMRGLQELDEKSE